VFARLAFARSFIGEAGEVCVGLYAASQPIERLDDFGLRGAAERVAVSP
jgi:hypothetical protein